MTRDTIDKLVRILRTEGSERVEGNVLIGDETFYAIVYPVPLNRAGKSYVVTRVDLYEGGR